MWCRIVALLVLGVAGWMDFAQGDIIIEYIQGPQWAPRERVTKQTSRPEVGKLPPPPPIDDVARMARYVVHYSEWTSLGHISHQKATNWYPSSRAFSMADGPIENSTGVPYIYTSYHDSVPRDLKVDPRCSMSMSLASTEFCSDRHLDPEDPRCPQVILTGHFVIVENNTEEWKFAENALFTRHPEMKTWPDAHHFFFGKLDIQHIQIVDNIGGSKYPSLESYFNSPPPMPSDRKRVNAKTLLRLGDLNVSNDPDSSFRDSVEAIEVNMIN